MAEVQLLFGRKLIYLFLLCLILFVPYGISWSIGIIKFSKALYRQLTKHFSEIRK